MKNYYLYAILLILYTVGSALVLAYEEPKYKVIQKQNGIEIREYEPYIVAQAVVSSDFEEAGNIGHRMLFAYISGENSGSQKMEMTTPVTQESSEKEGEKIEMTVPVNQEKMAQGQYRISFVMPSRYTMETLPEPRDKRIVLKKIPARKVIVIKYSGTWSTDNYKEHEAKLMDYIQENNHVIKGEPMWARYDPPFMPWFLRRNEIMIEIE